MLSTSGLLKRLRSFHSCDLEWGGLTKGAFDANPEKCKAAGLWVARVVLLNPMGSCGFSCWARVSNGKSDGEWEWTLHQSC